jgi:fluoroquinolone transport system permease protein
MDAGAMNVTVLVLDEPDSPEPVPGVARQQMIELIRSGALRRSLRWQPMLGALVLTTALLASKLPDLVTSDAVLLLRFIAVLLAVGAAFAFDDASLQLVSAVPLSLARRLSLRAAVIMLTTVPAWCVAVLLTTQSLATTPDGLISGVTLEFGCLHVIGLAIAASVMRCAGMSEPGIFAGPALIGLMMVLMLLPARWQLLGPLGPHWAAAHQRWAYLLTSAVAVLVLAARDPAARSIESWGRYTPAVWLRCGGTR